MARDNLYKIALIKSSGGIDEFEVYKLDEDFFHLQTYHVSRRSYDNGSRVFFACDCYAGNRSVCRHRTMVKRWIEEPANRDKAIDFDRGVFLSVKEGDSLTDEYISPHNDG